MGLKSRLRQWIANRTVQMNEIFSLPLNIYRHLRRFLREYRALRDGSFRGRPTAAMLRSETFYPRLPH